MRVAVDLDGVLYDFATALREYLKVHNYNTSKLTPPVTWRFSPEWGMTPDEFDRVCADAVNAGVLFAVGPPIPEAVEALDRLVGRGHTIHIVTARNFGDSSERNTRYWLDYYNIPRSTLTFASDKSILDADIFVDDRPDNVDRLRAAGKRAWLIRDLSVGSGTRLDHEGHPWLVETWEDFEAQVELVDMMEMGITSIHPS